MDVFGEAKDDAKEPRLKVMWPCRPLNLIEGELTGRMIEAMTLMEHRSPMVFVEDNTWNADDYAALYGELTAFEAMAMRDIVLGEVVERFRRQLIVARELGDPATLELYQIACEVEGIDPIIRKGITP